MDAQALAGELAAEISKRLKRSKLAIPVGVSSRHVHITQEHLAALFGAGSALTKLRDLKQPGQFAAQEKIDVAGPKGVIRGVRVLGPCRAKTQIEVSMTDARALGLEPPVRESGNLAGSAGARLIGPKGQVEVREGLIVSRRHIHVSAKEAGAWGFSDGESVRTRLGRGKEREAVLEGVVVRVSEKFSLELHLDTDEANACGVGTGEVAYIV